jgi:hypothetical protein
MRQGDEFEIPGEMAEVRRDIEEWRSTRTRHCRPGIRGRGGRFDGYRTA